MKQIQREVNVTNTGRSSDAAKSKKSWKRPGLQRLSLRGTRSGTPFPLESSFSGPTS
jgi:hypothetical protein